MTNETLIHEDMAVLKAPFAAEEHSFDYDGRPFVEEKPVCERIEMVDPAWGMLVGEPVFQITEGHVSVKVSLTIKGVTREDYGTRPIMAGKRVQESVKGAVTNALRRAARRFGIGRYLLDAPNSVQSKGKDITNLRRWLAELTGTPAKPQRQKQQPQPNDGKGPQQEPGPEPQERDVMLVSVKVLTDVRGKDYYGFRTEDDTPVTTFSRELFVAGFYMERGDWQGARKEPMPLDPKIRAKIRIDNGYWKVKSVIPYIPEDPSWQASIARTNAPSNTTPELSEKAQQMLDDIPL